MRKISIILVALLVFLTGCGSQSKNTSKIGTNSTFEINYYSVGNADAALVECDSHYMLIDCGSDDSQVTDSSNIYKIDRYLKEKDITHFDYLICSHPDNDHYEGFVDLLKGDGQERTFDKFYCSTKPSDDTTQQFREFVNEIEAKKKKISVPKEGDVFKLGSASIEVLALNCDNKKTTNDSSIVLMITYGENKFLFTGDAQSVTEAYLVSNKDIKCDVLKVAHHGSNTSTSSDFLGNADPDYAVISAGSPTEHRHPSGDVLSRIERKNIKLYTTDNGTVVCKSDGKNITIEYRK